LQLFDKARAAFQEMLAIETGGANQRAIGEALYGLARAAAAQGDMVEARRLGEESAGILEKIGHLTAPEIKQWLAQDAS